MITNFKDQNNKSKKKYRKYKTLTTTLKSFDTIVIIATKSSSITLRLTGKQLLAIPVSTATACGLSFGNKVAYEIMMNKSNNYKNQYEKDPEASNSFDKFYKKYLQDILVDKNEYESPCSIFIKFVDETKNEHFFENMNIKTKANFLLIILT